MERQKWQKFYAAERLIKIWGVNVDNIVISKLVKTRTKYVIWFLDEAIRLLVLIMTKMNGYVKTLVVEDKSSKFMFFHKDYEELLKNIKLFGLRSKTWKILN